MLELTAPPHRPVPPGGCAGLAVWLLAELLLRDLGCRPSLGVAAPRPTGHTLFLTGAGTLPAGPRLRRVPYVPFALCHVTRLVRMTFVVAVRAAPAGNGGQGPPR